MAEFGWAYISGSVTGKGPAKSVQFIETADGELTGSQNFTYSNSSSQLFITGSVVVSGTLQAHTFDIIQTNIIEMTSSGNTSFGDSSDDTHNFTGSVNIVSGGLSQHYYKLTGSSHTQQAYDSIIGVSSSAYVSITLQTAAAAGFGRTLIIKDEYNATRTDSTRIAVTASGADKIDHATTYSITGDNAALTLYSDGINKWFIY